MAKIQFGVIVTQGRGKLNGSQFSVNRSGAVLQNKCQQRRGTTSAQSAARSGFSFLGRYWRTLSPTQQAENNSATPNYPYTDKFGNTRYFTGYQLLLRSNINRRYSGLGPISVVPSTPPAGFDLVDIELGVYELGGFGFNLTLTWLGTSPNPENYSVQVFNSPMVSAGVSLYSGRYVFLTYSPADLGEVSVQPINNGTQFNWVAGERVFAKVAVIHNESGIEVANYVVSALIQSV